MGNTGLSDLFVIAIVGAFLLSILDAFLKPSRRRAPRKLRLARKTQVAWEPRYDREPRFVRKRFLTTPEARVLPLLEAALPQYRIMAQVAMGALLQAGEINSFQAKFTRYRFAQKIVDFVIVRRDTAEVIALVELDDSSHDRLKDAERDAMTASAGYCTIRIPVRPQPTLDSVRAALGDIIAIHPTGIPLPSATGSSANVRRLERGGWRWRS